MSKRLENKVALVFGGTSGIGAATAKRFGMEGAKVVVAGRNEQRGQAVVDEICASGEDAVFIGADYTDESQVAEAVRATVQHYGRLDAAVNTPGGGHGDFVVDLKAEDWKQVIDLNLTGTFYAIKYEAAQMKRDGGGSIVSISSINSTVPNITMSAYCAAKAGMDMLSKCAAMELGPDQIRVNVINPGYVETPLIRQVMENQEMLREILYNTPTRKLCKPEDIAAMALFLCSDEACNITASCMVVDGGESTEGHPDVPQIKYGLPRSL